MQPVLEIRKLDESSYTYTVCAPSSDGAPPSHACYIDLGLTSFAACLHDAAQALTYFHKVCIHYEGICVGEHAVTRLENQSEAVARELIARYERELEVPPMA